MLSETTERVVVRIQDVRRDRETPGYFTLFSAAGPVMLAQYLVSRQIGKTQFSHIDEKKYNLNPSKPILKKKSKYFAQTVLSTANCNNRIYSNS